MFSHINGKLSNDVAEHRPSLKNNQNTYHPRFGFTPKRGKGFPKTGFFFFLCSSRLGDERWNTRGRIKTFRINDVVSEEKISVKPLELFANGSILIAFQAWRAWKAVWAAACEPRGSVGYSSSNTEIADAGGQRSGREFGNGRSNRH